MLFRSHYHKNKTPQTYHEAQVSLPYSVAVALKEGQALLKQYTDRKLKDPVLRRISDIVDISVDESLPRGVSCKMTMTMNNGEQYVSQIDYPKGSIQNPMSDDELRTKFNTLAIPVIGDSHAAQLADLVAEVEQVTDIGKLMRLTAKPKRKARK